MVTVLYRCAFMYGIILVCIYLHICRNLGGGLFVCCMSGPRSQGVGQYPVWIIPRALVTTNLNKNIKSKPLKKKKQNRNSKHSCIKLQTLFWGPWVFVYDLVFYIRLCRLPLLWNLTWLRLYIYMAHIYISDHEGIISIAKYLKSTVFFGVTAGFSVLPFPI